MRHKGRLALVNTNLTPSQATVADLLFVREALEASAIRFLLIHGTDERPVIAVDRKDRKAAERTRAELNR